MSDHEWQERIEKLERRLFWRTILFGAALVVAVIALFPRERPVPPLTRVDLPGTHLMRGTLLMFDASISARPDVHNGAVLTVSPLQALLSLSAGGSELMMEVSDRKPTVTITADGSVRSVVAIDTSTGAWTLSRARALADGKYGPEVVQQLVPPLPGDAAQGTSTTTGQ